MITLFTAIGSLILALLSVISYLFNKNKTLAGQAQENTVKAQVNANDAQIKANQDQIQQIKDQTAAQEKNETNDSILNDLNKPK